LIFGVAAVWTVFPRLQATLDGSVSLTEKPARAKGGLP
jgi:hypothetical protein